MNDVTARLNVRTRITAPSGRVYDREYSLDLNDPELDRFQLTDEERHRVEQLLFQAVAVWEDGTAEEGTFAEPLKTLLDVATETISEALAREIENDHHREAVAL